MKTNYYVDDEDKEYLIKSEQHIKEFFIKGDKIFKKTKSCKNFVLNVYNVTTGKNTWEYCCGKIIKDGKELYTIYRNYPYGVWEFIEHKNGDIYLLCGHNYQGYTVINLTKEIVNIYLHPNFKLGGGWCFADFINFDSNEQTVKIEGCIWGGPYEYRTYDFTNPDAIPLPILSDEYVDYDNDDDND